MDGINTKSAAARRTVEQREIALRLLAEAGVRLGKDVSNDVVLDALAELYTNSGR